LTSREECGQTRSLHLRLCVMKSAKWEAEKLAGADCWICKTTSCERPSADITKGDHDPTGQARMLDVWRGANIRYVSGGREGTITMPPYRPWQVYSQNRFGDCKDHEARCSGPFMAERVASKVELVTLSFLGGSGTFDEARCSSGAVRPWGTHAILRRPSERPKGTLDFDTHVPPVLPGEFFAGRQRRTATELRFSSMTRVTIRLHSSRR